MIVATSSNQEEEKSLLNDFKLYQNYPNPFNPSTKIQYVIPNRVRNPKDFSSQMPRNDNTLVTLIVYDVLGNEVATLVNEYKPAGSYEVNFEPVSSIKNIASGIGYASGVYFYRLKAGNPESGSGQIFTETKKMILLR